MSGEKRTPVPARQVLTDPVHFLAFGFGTGLAPVAPGTVGSLPGMLIAWATLPLPLTWRLAIGVLLVLTGIWLCGESARRIGVHDHSGIVWDEIAGMYLVLLVAPPQIAAWVLGFALFRLFDIWKPWPIRDLDHRLAGGAGIMLDDVIAALYAASLLVLGGILTG
jgi:phosphatidylglycerophosphatase A